MDKGIVIHNPQEQRSWFHRHPAVTITCVVALSLALMELVGGQVYNNIERRRAEQALTETGQKDFRRPSPVYHHDLIPNKSVERVMWGGERFSVKTNSMGFRDESIRDVPLASKHQRMIFIGDSFTFGEGVDYTKTFVGIIQQRLKQRDIQVLNAAVSSYCPLIYFRKIKYLIEEVGLRFQELIVFMDISDPNDEFYRYALDAHQNVIAKELDEANRRGIGRQGLPYLAFITLRDNTILFRSFWWGVFRRHYDPLPINLRKGMWTVDKQLYEEYGREGLEKMRDSMDRLLAVLNPYGIKLTIAVYPWPDQIWHRDSDSIQVRFWRDWARENKVKFVNLFPLFVNDTDPKQCTLKYFIRGDLHWNEEGHKLVAEGFLPQYSKTAQGRVSDRP